MKILFQKVTLQYIKLPLSILAICILLVPIDVQAYRSLPNDSVKYPKMPNAATTLGYYYDQINSELGIAGSATLTQHAINQWDTTSWYTLFGVGNGGMSTPATDNMMRYIIWCHVIGYGLR